jgi:hypothetical protein
MSFQAYIDTIKAKTGKTPDDFYDLAKQQGLLEPNVPTSVIVDWLKRDFNLGRGHAMALVVTFNTRTKPKVTPEEGVEAHFLGDKHRWRETFDKIVAMTNAFGPGVSVWPGGSYLSLLRVSKKFAIVQITGARMDIGIKRKGAPADGRFETAGSWNSMVTHRVRITDPVQIDNELAQWLKAAFELAR